MRFKERRYIGPKEYETANMGGVLKGKFWLEWVCELLKAENVAIWNSNQWESP